MIELRKHHRNDLMLALLGSFFFFAFTANAFGDLEEYFVGDFVWFDTDCDGIQDYDEPGVPDVLVSAFKCDTHEPIGETTVTDEHGLYWLSLGQFENAPPDFFLCFVLPDDLKCDFTSPKGNKGAKDSDVNTDGCTDCIHWEDHWGNECDRWDAAVCCPDCTGTIGDFVWLDKNCDGIQDDGEPGIEDVEICLVKLLPPDFLEEDPDFDEVCTTTNADGFYQFTGLCADTYLVTVNPATLPLDYFATLRPQGIDTEFDSDDPDGTEVTLPQDDSSNPTIDFGYCSPCTGEIGDYVWFDKDCDGIQDDSEVGIEDVEICLVKLLPPDFLEEDPDFDEVCTTTNADGFYQFTGLCAGTYMVTVNPDTLPQGHFATLRPQGIDREFDSDDPDGTEVTLPTDSSSDPTIDFGYCSPCTGEIGDFVWFDKDCDGIQDGAEVGIEGVEICLTKLGDSSFEVCTTTNGDGFYQFNGLCAGTYMVTVNPSTVPAGFDPTDFLQGGDGALDSDDPTETFVVLKFDDSTDPTIDFGYCLDCQECSGGITELTLRYLGISSPVDIEVFDKKSVSLFQGVASSGSDFTFSGMDKDGKMGTEISVFVDGFFNTKIHTSCSRPIGPGLVSGDFEVVGGTSLKGGPLCPVEPPDDDCGPCKGKVTQLTLMYTGDTEATIRVEQKKDAKIVFNDVVPAFGFFEFNGQDKNGTLGTEILVYVDDALSTKIHTSCSQPIGPGLVFGDFIVVEGSSLKGGPLCPFDTPPGDEDCGPCKGKVTELTLRYTGADAFVEVVQKKDNAVVYGAELDSGDAFTFSGQDKDGTLGTEIKVFVNSSLNATIHTSCSKPIGPGLVFGDFEVVAGQSKDGGPLCIGGDDDKKGGKKDKKKGGKKGRKKGGKKGGKR